MHCTLEVCVDSTASALAAKRGGADRLELCADLIIGGTTPSPALLRQVKAETGLPVRALIRPRFGDFCYDRYELAQMAECAAELVAAGADGIVTGVLTPTGALDTDALRPIYAAARQAAEKAHRTVDCTLHRAFDVCCDPFAALEAAKQLGLATILTSGQAVSAPQGAALLQQLVEAAGQEVEILVGAGVSAANIPALAAQTGARAFHLSGKQVLLSVYDPATKERFEEQVKPITYGTQSDLLYKRWVEQKRQMVDKLSNGKIGYVHVKGMNSESFRDTYSELLGRCREKEAVIVDTRHNGGGWLHEDLAILLSGELYAKFTPRGQFIGNDPFNRWLKPSCVLMCEDNYSNAHGFPWTYKTLKIGKLIGAPVPGTMTAVWWETQIDPSIVFGIPQVGMQDMQGRYLENQQLEPDIEVYNSPESQLRGEDHQLEEAVKEMLKEVQK